MHLRLAILALVACTDSSVTARERLHSFQEQTEIICEQSIGPGIRSATAEMTLSCMNDALASGVRAEVSWIDQDTSGFDVATSVFTVDRQVRVFESHPNGNDFSPEPTASELETCAGPFRLGDSSYDYTRLEWDGCP